MAHHHQYVDGNHYHYCNDCKYYKKTNSAWPMNIKCPDCGKSISAYASSDWIRENVEHNFYPDKEVSEGYSPTIKKKLKRSVLIEQLEGEK